MSLLQKTVVYGLANVWVAMKDLSPIFIQVGSVWDASDPVVKAWRGKGLFGDTSPIANASQVSTPGSPG